MILGAIDIGSNAARLLIASVSQNNGSEVLVNELNLLRVPLRLGFDVFEKNEISLEKIEMMKETMLSFQHMMKAYKVNHYKAFATSAMRDAANSYEVINYIKDVSNIHVHVISGEQEANLIFETHFAENLPRNNNYMYIDVGGGSTEISFFKQGKLVGGRSFNIGTIRLLKNRVAESDWSAMKNFISSFVSRKENIISIGSGGNINKVFSLSKRKEGKPLPLELLKDYYKELECVSFEDRINKYKLKPDRADVIVPALSVYINAMRWGGSEEILVPKIGMADGLIRHLWKEISSK